MISGVAMPYGRLATSFVGLRLERGEGHSSASPTGARWSDAGEQVAERRLERAVDLDGMDHRDAVGEVPREDAQARADLEDDVRAIERSEAADDPEDVLVDEEVLAEGLLGRDGHARPKQPRRSRASGRRALTVVTARLGEPRACGRLERARSVAREPAAVRGTGCPSRRACGRPARAPPRRNATALGYVTFPANET